MRVIDVPRCGEPWRIVSRQTGIEATPFSMFRSGQAAFTYPLAILSRTDGGPFPLAELGTILDLGE